MRLPRLLPACLLALAAALFAAPSAGAHPMGNFTISHAADLRAERDRVTLRYRLDVAEIPSVTEMRDLDADNSGDVTPTEAEAYLEQKVPKLTRGLTLTVDGEPRTLEVVDAEIAQRPGAGGLATLLVTIDYVVPLAPSDAPRTVAFRDGNYAGLTGWREIVAAAGDGVRLLESSVPTTSDSDGLMTYPADELAAPPQVFDATFTFAPDDAAVAAAPATKPTTAPSDAGKPEDRFARLIAADNLNLGVVLVSLAIAFTLGCFHALAPGHGKTVVAAYLVGARGTAKHAALLGAIVTLTHTIGVFALGLIVLFLSEYVLAKDLYPWLGFASGMIIVAIGLWSLTRRLAAAYTPGEAATLADPHGPGGHTHAIPDKITFGSLLALGVSGGMVPCPSALVVLLSAVALGRVAFGLVLIVAFSLGLAMILIVIGLLVLHAQRAFQRFRWSGGLFEKLPVVSAVAVTVIGGLIAWRSLADAGAL